MKTEIKGEDYFEIGGVKFNKEVTLADAIQVLKDRNIQSIKKYPASNNLFMRNLKQEISEKISNSVDDMIAQEIIDSIDTSIKEPRGRA